MVFIIIDVWAFGAFMYEALSGMPLKVYSPRGKREMTDEEKSKIGDWNDERLKKALKAIKDVTSEEARNLLSMLLQGNPEKRVGSLIEVVNHKFFEKIDNEEDYMVNINEKTGYPDEKSKTSLLCGKRKSGKS